MGDVLSSGPDRPPWRPRRRTVVVTAAVALAAALVAGIVSVSRSDGKDPAAAGSSPPPSPSGSPFPGGADAVVGAGQTPGLVIAGLPLPRGATLIKHDRTALPAAADREPHRWFAGRLLEVLTGRHPVSRMLGLTTGPGVYDRVWELAVSGALHPPAGSPTPQVRHCGFRDPVPEAREAWAVVSCGEALRALAFRLEQGSGERRWRCAALDFTGPGW